MVPGKFFEEYSGMRKHFAITLAPASSADTVAMAKKMLYADLCSSVKDAISTIWPPTSTTVRQANHPLCSSHRVSGGETDVHVIPKFIPEEEEIHPVFSP